MNKFPCCIQHQLTEFLARDVKRPMKSRNETTYSSANVSWKYIFLIYARSEFAGEAYRTFPSVVGFPGPDIIMNMAKPACHKVVSTVFRKPTRTRALFL